MHEGKRPGGLTALAVINFIFGGFGALGILMMVVLLGVLGAMPDDPDVDQQMREALEQAGPIFLVSIVLGAISTLLLILSGVGYLQQKRFLGRTLGTIYGLIQVVSAVVTAALLPENIGGGTSIMTIVSLVYPVLTLVLLNTTFKHDFIR